MIIIERKKAWTDRLRKYIVVLDELEIGSFRENETFDYKVSPGTHTLYLKIDWCRSKKIEFEIEENETIYFKCSALSAFKLPVIWWYITVKSAQYIELEQVVS